MLDLILADFLKAAIVFVAIAAVAAVGSMPNDQGDTLLMHLAKLRYALGPAEVLKATACIVFVVGLYTFSGGARIAAVGLAFAGIRAHQLAERIAYTPLSDRERQAVGR